VYPHLERVLENGLRDMHDIRRGDAAVVVFRPLGVRKSLSNINALSEDGIGGVLAGLKEL